MTRSRRPIAFDFYAYACRLLSVAPTDGAAMPTTPQELAKHRAMRLRLSHLSACDEGADWCCTQPDIETAWTNCENPLWMLWLAMRLSPISESGSDLYAAADRADDDAIAENGRILDTERCDIIRSIIPASLIANEFNARGVMGAAQ